MSKAVIFTDIHWGKSKDAISKIDVINTFFEKFTEWVVTNKIKTAFFLGDFFDSRNSINVYTLCTAYDALRKLTEHLDDLYMIVGNHDCYFNNEKVYINSLKPFSHIDNIHVIHESKAVKVGGKSFMMCPWGSIPEAGSKYDYLLGHFHPNGTVYHNGEVVKDSTYSMTTLFEYAPVVFSGHVHQHKINDFDAGNFVYVGSPYELDFGDTGSTKGWIDLDISKNKYEHVKNTFSPVHLKYYWSQLIRKVNVPTKTSVKDNYIKLIIDEKFEYDKLFKFIAAINSLQPATVSIEYVFNTANTLLDNLSIDNTVNSKKVSNLEYIKQYVQKLEVDAGIDREELTTLIVEYYVKLETEIGEHFNNSSCGRINFEKITAQNFKSIGEKVEFNFSQNPELVYIYGTNKDMKGQANGSGKCTAANTSIDINFINDNIKNKFISYAEAFISNTNIYSTVGRVVDYYAKFPEDKGTILVNTPYGYKRVLAAEQTDYSIPCIIRTESGYDLTCSMDHRIKTVDELENVQDGFKAAKNIKVGDMVLTSSGLDFVVMNEQLVDAVPLYDLQVEDVQQYYSNGIVSHNSTLFVDALCFGLFCKTLKNTNNEFIPNRLLVNSNLNTEVSVWFSVGTDKYQTIATIKKGGGCVSFKVFKNGEDQTKSTSMKSREWVESILQCEFEFFKNSMIVSSSDKYVFFEQGKHQRRTYIETLLKLSIFGDMLKKVRESINAVSNESLLIQRDIRNITQTLNEYKEKQTNLLADKKRAIDNINASIMQKRLELETIKSDELVLPLSDNERKVVESFDRIVDAKHKANASVKDFRNQIELVRKDIQHSRTIYNKHKEVLSLVCEDCNDVLLKHYNLDNIDSEEAELDIQITTLETKVDAAQAVATKIDKQYSTIQTLVKRSNDYMTEQNNKKIKISKTTTDIERLEEQLQTTENSNEMFGELVVKHTNELNNKIDLYKSIENRKKYLTLAEHVVSEDGVKKFIVKDVISTINNLVKKYLLEIGAEFIVVFDETFEYKFLTKSGECEYSSLSKGERQRLTVAMLFAFKDIISMDGIDSNVFIIDEILDDGLDESGIKAICSILKTRCNDKRQAAYIISHRAELAESNYFDSVVEVVKENGMTKITSKT